MTCLSSHVLLFVICKANESLKDKITFSYVLVIELYIDKIASYEVSVWDTFILKSNYFVETEFFFLLKVM